MTTLALWNGYMTNYDFLTKVDGYRQNIVEIAESLIIQPGLRVLDAGSGTGNLSLLLKERGAEPTAFDFSPMALSRHREKDPQAILVEGSLEDPLPFKDESFEAVCCASVLFSLSQEGCRMAIREFFRVLRPGGSLIITVSATEARLWKLVTLYIDGLVRSFGLQGYARSIIGIPALLKVLYYNRKLKNLPDWKGHHAFSAQELQGKINAAGFNNIQLGRTYGGVFHLAQAIRP